MMLCCLFFSCTTENNEELNTRGQLGGETAPDPSSIIYQTDLIAGQNILIGYVSVTLDYGNVYVNYSTEESDWEINETHLFIGDLNDLPTNNNGNPQIGHFPFSEEHTIGTNTVFYLGNDLLPGDCFYVAAHAVVTNTTNGQEETAWADGEPIGENSWAMMFEACIP